MLSPEALYERPIPERHRNIFYLGHLEAFDWNLLRDPVGLEPFHPTFDRLFAFGIDPQVGASPTDQPSDWPALGEIQDYCLRVRDAIDARLRTADRQLVHVALEHRLMHAETFAYMLHNLPYETKTAVASEVVSGVPPAAAAVWIDIPAGPATLGRESGDGFGWDNEFRVHVLQVDAFAISKYKVTNGEYLEFVRAGAAPPHFWVRRGKEWFYRGMFAEVPLPLDWPAYVTHEEAEAYARWKGKALPTEPQFHRAAFGTPGGTERLYPWGDDAPGPSRGNFDFARWDPLPVTATPRGESAFGVSQLLGNGWEWTSTPFAPFPGFEPFRFYPGYSADFFDGDHFVLKGGSARTAATAAPLLRRSFRNWFRRNYPYVYAGFRLVEN
jgi:formylglycine-generating enzyme required for sulfatase activity